MSELVTHDPHEHVHGADCGHTAFKHGDHIDYAQDGHLHHMESGQVVECAIPIDEANPSVCTPAHDCEGHDAKHTHGAGCGHDAIPHGDHVDFLVRGHLHHAHGDHCDDHGPVGGPSAR